jgi:hypothetical protein
MSTSNQIIVIFSTLIAITLFVTYLLYKRGNKTLERLWNEYKQALQSGDKKRALDAGRRYYSRLRNGRLTIYDEQAIANDLSTMK